MDNFTLKSIPSPFLLFPKFMGLAATIPIRAYQNQSLKRPTYSTADRENGILQESIIRANDQ